MLVAIGCRFIAAHLVGRRLIYPGSLSLLNAVLCEFSGSVCVGRGGTAATTVDYVHKEGCHL